MINYVKGDATEPIGSGTKIIVHVCNDIGKWGAGFVLALSNKWSEPEAQYKSIKPERRKLGMIQYVNVESDTIVVNMIGQHTCSPNLFGVPPVRYEAIGVCLRKVAEFAGAIADGGREVSIHMPEIGCGLAGGKWSIMEKVIENAVGDIPVTCYEFVPPSLRA